MRRLLVLSCVALFSAGCTGADDGSTGTSSQAVVTAGGYTTFDVQRGGCLDTPNGSGCTVYEYRDDVFISGGPKENGLADGTYFFAVLSPGAEGGGFVDGAPGNLSGDARANRTFTVWEHDIVAYAGTHAWGKSPDGRPILQLAPYAVTAHPDGVYVVALCPASVSHGTGGVAWPKPRDCRFDAFKASSPTRPPPPFAVVTGGVYYDSNVNGAWDVGEFGLAGWPVESSDPVTGVVTTVADGVFSARLIAGAYSFWQHPAVGPVTTHDGETVRAWRQTGNLVSQLTAAGGATATLLPDMTYSVKVIDGSVVTDLFFGNVCVGAGGGKSKGFWSNKHGEALVTEGDLAMLRVLELRTGSGAAFDPATFEQLRDWLRGANASNMANMLSAQLAAMELNVAHGFVAGGGAVTTSQGYTSVTSLMEAANASLAAHGYTVGGDPERAHQEALKDALDGANNGEGYVQPNPSTCPAPVF